MRYPPPPRRPQAYRVRSAGARRRPRRASGTWHFRVAALALLAVTAAVANSRSAVAAPDGPPSLGAVGGAPAVGREAAPDPSSASAPAPRPSPALAEPGVGDPVPVPAPRDAATGMGAPAALAGRLNSAGQGRQLRARLTAYSASVEEGTAWGITRSGTQVRPGVVAVDLAVIPLGSRLRIAGLPGTFVAEDTGGGIRGAHIDVYMESRADAFRFGLHQSVLVEVLD